MLRISNRRPALAHLIGLIGAAALLSACASGMTGQQPPLAGISPRASAHASASTVTVAIINFSYFPSTITIKAGTTVKFVNRDIVEHTVTAKSGAFTSPLIGPGVSWKHTFKRAGISYHYYCQVHPSMTGIVKVIK